MLCTEARALEAAEIVSAGTVGRAMNAFTSTFIKEIEKTTQEADLLSPQGELVLLIVKKAMALAMIDVTVFLYGGH